MLDADLSHGVFECRYNIMMLENLRLNFSKLLCYELFTASACLAYAIVCGDVLGASAIK
jgi:hypothetical protein